MPSPFRLERQPTPLGFAPIFLANLIPLVGVFQLGWDPATLVVIYTLELLVSFPLAAAKALFAQRPPRTDRDGLVSVSSELTQKRGSIELVPWLPPIYPRTIPFATAVVGFAVQFVIMIGIVLSHVITVAEIITRPEVLVSGLALVVGQSVEIWRDYARGGYETASPYTVIETPARQAFFLAFVLFVTPGIAAGGAAAVLTVVVLAKLLVEWSAYRATHGSGGRLTGWLAGPETEAETPDSVRIPDDEREPAVRIPTNSRAVLYTGVFHVLGRLAPFLAMPFIFIWLIVLILLGGEAPTVMAIGASLVVLALFAGFLALKIAAFYLRYGPLEYRRYGDRLVAYDTLLEESQWSASVEVLRNVQVVPDRLPDRLLETRTIAVTTGRDDGDSRRSLGPVSDPDALVDAFGLPVRTTALDPLDRRPVGVVVACLVAIVVALVVLVAGPWISPAELLSLVGVYGIFGIPFIAITFGVLWAQAYPERSE